MLCSIQLNLFCFSFINHALSAWGKCHGGEMSINHNVLDSWIIANAILIVLYVEFFYKFWNSLLCIKVGTLSDIIVCREKRELYSASSVGRNEERRREKRWLPMTTSLSWSWVSISTKRLIRNRAIELSSNIYVYPISMYNIKVMYYQYYQ